MTPCKFPCECVVLGESRMTIHWSQLPQDKPDQPGLATDHARTHTDTHTDTHTHTHSGSIWPKDNTRVKHNFSAFTSKCLMLFICNLKFVSNTDSSFWWVIFINHCSVCTTRTDVNLETVWLLSRWHQRTVCALDDFPSKNYKEYLCGTTCSYQCLVFCTATSKWPSHPQGMGRLQVKTQNYVS